MPSDYIHINLKSPYIIYKEYAESTDTPPKILNRLSKHTNVDIRSAVAANLSTPLIAIRRLAIDENENVRSELAENIAVPPSILKILAQDTSPRVIASVSRNPALTAQTIISLYKNNPDKEVLIGLAGNPKTPPQLLKILSKDNSGGYFPISAHVAGNPSTPLKVLEELYNSGEYWSLSQLATNPSSSANILKRIFNKYSTDKLFINALVKNPSSPPELLKDIYETNGNTYINELAQNPNTPMDTIEEILNPLAVKHRESEEAIVNRPDLSYKAFELLLSGPTYKYIVSKALAHPNMPKELSDRYIEKTKGEAKTKLVDGKNIPGNKLVNKFNSPVKQKTNPDLELLLRLKGYLHNA